MVDLTSIYQDNKEYGEIQEIQIHIKVFGIKSINKFNKMQMILNSQIVYCD